MLYRRRENLHFNLVSASPKDLCRFTTPQALHQLNPLEGRFPSVCITAWSEDKIVRMPTRCKSNPDPPSRYVIHQRPFFRYPDRMVQRQHDASCSDLHPFCYRCQGCAHYRGIGEQPPERMKMALRCPDRFKIVSVCKLCPFKQQSISLLSPLRITAGEVEEAEINPLLLAHSHPFPPHTSQSLLAHHDPLHRPHLRPPHLQHRYVKCDAGQRH